MNLHLLTLIALVLGTRAQNRPFEDDVDSDVLEFRLSLAGVAEEALSRVIFEVDESNLKIQNLEAPIRDAMNELPESECAISLRNLVKVRTIFTKYQSSNCATFYQRLVNEKMRDIGDIINIYHDKWMKPVVYNKYEMGTSQKNKVLDDRANEHTGIVTSINNAIDVDMPTFAVSLQNCMLGIQNSLVRYYELLMAEIETCVDFGLTPYQFHSHS